MPVTATQVRFYVNGILWSFGGGIIDARNSEPLLIGSTLLTPCHIELDEVQIFSRGLQQSEIEDIYSAGSAGKCKCEPLPDGSGCTASCPNSNDTCRAQSVQIILGPVNTPFPLVTDCTCAGPCGPISIKNDPGTNDYALSCFGNCPPNIVPLQSCQVHINGAALGQDLVFVPNLAIGDVVTCDCAGVGDPCDDERFCNGLETAAPNGDCIAGDPPCAVDFLCDEVHDTCLEAIPAVSEWGLMILTLLLLIGAKVYFAQRDTSTPL